MKTPIRNENTFDLVRWEELAAGYALGDLSESEMNEWKNAGTDQTDRLGVKNEETAARLFLSFQENRLESMPNDLTHRLKMMAGDLSKKVETVLYEEPSMRAREVLAWLAMAAAVAFALCAWLPSTLTIKVAAVPDWRMERELLLSSASDLIRSVWESTAETSPTETSLKEAGAPYKPGDQRDFGDIVWSESTQRGFMRLTGLAKNDPLKEQYQLWILDPARDEKPVDGGVFDISREGESIVPIQAKLKVGKPSLFAITVEKPGGVVVSDQKRLPRIAKVMN